ncbi:MAG: hypothetical protein K0S47_4684 [Herbinix sp.]|nr:hypothetical protein [Herbinix sp.]
MKNKILCIMMLCAIMLINTSTSFAQAATSQNVTNLRNSLINTIYSSKDSYEIAQANKSLNQIIESEVKQNTVNQPRVGYKIINYTSSTVSSYQDRKGNFKKAYTTGTSESISITVSISASTPITIAPGVIVSLGASISGSASTTISGPPYGTLLPGSQLSATHAVAIGILRGTVVHEIYDVVDATTGQQISHVDQYVIGGATTTTYNLLVSNTANGYYVGHCSQQTYKYFSNETVFKGVINSTNPTPGYSW